MSAFCLLLSMRNTVLRFNLSEDAIRIILHDAVETNLLSLSLMMKKRYGSGCMHKASARKLMREFRMGKSTAKKYFELAKRSGLFLFENGNLTALNYNKTFIQKKKDKHGRAITCLTSYALSLTSITSLTRTRIALRKVVMCSAVYKNVVDKCSDKKGTCATHPAFIPLSYLSAATGVSRSSVSRYMKDEVSKGRIIKTAAIPFVFVRHYEGEEAPAFCADMALVLSTVEADYYLKLPTYDIGDRCVLKYWRHIILNAHGRLARHERSTRQAEEDKAICEDVKLSCANLVEYGCEFVKAGEYAGSLVMPDYDGEGYWKKHF